MNKNSPIDSITLSLVCFVSIVHLMFFVLEAIFWMLPEVHNQLLHFLDNPVSLSYPIQALVLKSLFINQGFYNLFLLCAGIYGLFLIRKGKPNLGYILILFFCFAATGAGIVLALSTKAYVLAFFQAGPALVTFVRINNLYKINLNNN